MEEDTDKTVGGGGRSAVAEIAGASPEADKDGKITPDAAAKVMDATEWLLGSFDRNTEVTHTLELNVGGPAEPVWINWTIRAIEGAELRRIRARAADSVTSASSRKGRDGALKDTEAAFRANVDLIVAATVAPDLVQAAQRKGLADPGLIVEEAFSNKQGLVDQVAGEVMSLSGYDDEDVRDAVEQRAAGNSRG